jgi:hypothetical protein
MATYHAPSYCHLIGEPTVTWVYMTNEDRQLWHVPRGPPSEEDEEAGAALWLPGGVLGCCLYIWVCVCVWIALGHAEYVSKRACVGLLLGADLYLARMPSKLKQS